MLPADAAELWNMVTEIKKMPTDSNFYLKRTSYNSIPLQPELNILIDEVRRAREGNRSSAALLYSHFSKAMFNLCIRMTGNREDAEDVLQESFVIAFKKLDQLKNDNLFAGWLKKIVVSECCKLNKKKFKWTELSTDEKQNESEDSSWLEIVSSKKMHEAIKGLPEGCRQVFNLFAVEDYSHKQVAEYLNISESTSKSQYQRARRLLKDHLLKNISLHG